MSGIFYLKNINLVILFSGNGSNMQNIIEVLREKKFSEISKTSKKQIFSIHFPACITNNPCAYGITRCKELKIPCYVLPHTDFSSREEFDKALIKLIQPYRPKLVVLAGFMRVLSPIFVSTFKTLNIHPSLLPKHKGVNAIKNSFMSNNKNGGVSVHLVDNNLDNGQIISQVSLPKILNESLECFTQRIHDLEYELYPEAILKFLKLSRLKNPPTNIQKGILEEGYLNG